MHEDDGPRRVACCCPERSKEACKMLVSFAIVHHANQFLITDGYDNREGIYEVLVDGDGRRGLDPILVLHRQYAIPLNLHISGTLLEAIAWYKPALLHDLRDLYHSGLDPRES